MVAVAADGPYGHAVTLVGVLVTIEAVVLAAVLASVHDPDALVLLVAAAQAVVVPIIARGGARPCRAVLELLPARLAGPRLVTNGPIKSRLRHCGYQPLHRGQAIGNALP
ncbi:hypothetical protein EMEDMD4_1280110 [Sinorhizobium medicae]|uniref:Uncharacterized protein n=1 Tax=Sinorhizobium medicae TaxID=110321 RepID=A0A508WRN8_9HYPH|nr:hypothetical protein EMEDMD4_1280110 [Sinorhizobium medicae]